ncbi:hypothetical protein AJ79_10165 [Helicocarpus griseus UAMH5409]|uniref:NACHT domain-containing protein n=1 Tax=Helicocarpus griseus UAMH5409 TaxID=1447875 RepID=A0A2B7WFB7_9EURO|nr:hypothetical protein AJ79_10165 [Helicocarpus griseus UAMH5409]
MTSRSRFRIHNPFHRRKRPGNADPQTDMVEAEEGGTAHSPLLDSPGKSSAQPNQSPQSSTPKDLWSAAYDLLGDEERNILSTVQISTTTSDLENPPQTALFISEIIQLTEKQYENFQQRGDGRLRESSQKVINAALSFKDIIDAVAASDPTHHAANRPEPLRSTECAIESSEYLADVLAHCAYVEDKFYTNSNGKITGDLGNAIIRLYRAILQYAAQIRTAQDPSMGRKLLDCVTAITEHPLTELNASVEKERDNITRWIGLVQYLHHEEKANNILQRIDELRESMKLLTEQFNLVNLSIAKGAFYDSYADQHEGFCLPNTRTRLRSQITDWAESADGKCIFWLKGMAGTGKSTIARTVAQTFKEKQQLGATFFFKKGEQNRADAKYLIPTITKQLVTRHRQLAPGVLKAIKDDPDISAKSLTGQFDKLLLQPLQGLSSSESTSTVIVIDALDERQKEDIPIIINLLSQLQESKVLRVRIFLTSRPELPVRLGFKQSDGHQDLDLYELPNPVIEHDIRVFLKERFSIIRKSREITDDWPGNDTLDTLVLMAVPLFIFAATACRFIKDGRHPERRLKELLEAQAATSEPQMGKIYQPVLSQLLTDNDHESKELLQEFRDIVGVIINLATPLSVDSLTEFLDLPKRTITDVLDPLHSVLNIHSDPVVPVRILHLSFREYLLTTETKFHVDEQETHHKIALHCLRVMNDRLKRNICGLSSYGTQRDNINSQTINHHLPAVLQYSCRYWVHHLQQSRHCISEFPILPFLKTHFLHWFEALCLMGIASEAVGMIETLQALVAKNANTEISKFLYDARRFTLRNAFMTSTVPLQLYYSGLIFSPKQSVVRKMYSDNIPKWICPLPQVEATWSSNLQTLMGHSNSVHSVAFSSDGSTLASGSSDDTIKLWDVETGKELQTLMGHSGSVKSVAFSSNGLTLASGSSDHTIKLWDVETSKELQTLRGHYGSFDMLVKLWDVQTDKVLQTLKSYSGQVYSVVFSPDGSTLASGSSDHIIKLWDIETDEELQILTGHSHCVDSVAFSPDGSTLASGLFDNTIKLWDIKSSCYGVIPTRLPHVR